MAANPITFEAIEAFERKTLTPISAWEAELIERLDDAALAAWAGERRRAAKAAETGRPDLDVIDDAKMVDAKDVKAVGSLLRDLIARQRAKPVDLPPKPLDQEGGPT